MTVDKVKHYFQSNVVGGPSIVFTRYHGPDTQLRGDGKPCKKVFGYDANSLYLWCLGQNMPTGFYKIWNVKDPGDEVTPLNCLLVFFCTICSTSYVRQTN